MYLKYNFETHYLIICVSIYRYATNQCVCDNNLLVQKMLYVYTTQKSISKCQSYSTYKLPECTYIQSVFEGYGIENTETPKKAAIS